MVNNGGHGVDDLRCGVRKTGREWERVTGGVP